MYANNRISVSHAFRFGMLVLAACLVLLGCLVMAGPGARAQSQAAEPVTAMAARVAGDPQKTRFVLDLQRSVAYTVVILPDPFRIVIDLPDVAFDLPVDIGRQGRGLVQRYRYGRVGEGKSRIVIDATGPVLIEKTFMVEPEAGGPARLVLDLVGSDERTYASIRDRLQPRDAAADPVEAAPREDAIEPAGSSLAPQSTSAARTSLPTPRPRPASHPLPVRNAALDTARATPAPAPQQASVAPADAGLGDMPLADAIVEPSAAFASPVLASPQPKPALPQRRKSKPIVVIDPGHGGVDPGAISASGTLEKDVVLGFAKTLRNALVASGRYDARLTRADDRFIALGKRVAFARTNDADLFISIHADSLKRGVAHGATVYTLSEKASDKEAAEIAASENKADLVGGVLEEVDSNELTDILVDLVHLETKNHSTHFARTLVGSLDSATRLNTKPHRNAGFRVLRAPDVPSVLLELGYLSSREDEKRMISEAWRKRVAGSMLVAIDRFFGTALSQRQ